MVVLIGTLNQRYNAPLNCIKQRISIKIQLRGSREKKEKKKGTAATNPHYLESQYVHL
jgi:hypothetical protein